MSFKLVHKFYIYIFNQLVIDTVNSKSLCYFSVQTTSREREKEKEKGQHGPRAIYSVILIRILKHLN